MPRRGLPETVRMRHDAHYVEALAASAGAPIGRLIAIDRIDPNPNQPRQVMGDLSELMASVAEKGVDRAARRPIARRPVSDYCRRAALPGGGSDRPPRAAGRHSGRRRHRGHRARAGREHPAEGPDSVRRSGGVAPARPAQLVHARSSCAEARQVANVHH